MRWTAATSELPEAAARMVEAGIPIFPCLPGRKQPLTPHGFHDATTDQERVKGWWRRTPEANIGLPTGIVSGVVVVDIDVHDRGNGFPVFERARVAGLVDGWSWLVRTPSGGLHAYFPANGPERRSWASPTTHIDFRGDGGYVVVPPSRIQLPTAERSYEVIAVAQHEPRTLDAAALRTFLEPPRPQPRAISLPVVGARPDKLAAWVASRPAGGRNHGLFWAACRLAESGHDVHQTLGVLGEAAKSAGLSEREAEATIRSAHRITGPLSTSGGPSPPSTPSGLGL